MVNISLGLYLKKQGQLILTFVQAKEKGHFQILLRQRQSKVNPKQIPNVFSYQDNYGDVLPRTAIVMTKMAEIAAILNTICMKCRFKVSVPIIFVALKMN